MGAGLGVRNPAVEQRLKRKRGGRGPRREGAGLRIRGLAGAAIEGGLDMLGYMNQARFLIDAGIGKLLLRTPREDTRRYLPRANAVQTLTSTAEMGELFKVLIVGTQVDLPGGFGEGPGVRKT